MRSCMFVGPGGGLGFCGKGAEGGGGGGVCVGVSALLRA